MTVFANPLNAQIAESYQGRATNGVIQAIHAASTSTGVDFAYLMQQAAAESNFDADAKAGTSSASGLYQFIESTWLNMVERHGDKYGIDTSASRDELLDLRDDPETAANLAAEFANDNKAFLEMHWDAARNGDTEIGATELYLAHFLGAGGAAAFLNARDENPLKIAADLFPSAAAANKNVFYDRETGRAKTLAEVYAFFDKKFQAPEALSSQTVTDAVAKTFQQDAVVFKAAKTKSNSQNSIFSGVFKPSVISPVEIMIMAQMETTLLDDRNKNPWF